MTRLWAAALLALALLPTAAAGAGPLRDACYLVITTVGGDDGDIGGVEIGAPGICEAVPDACEPVHVSTEGNLYVESECIEMSQEICAPNVSKCRPVYVMIGRAALA